MPVVLHLPVIFLLQKNLLEGLGLGAGGSIQVDFKGADGKPVRTATVKSKTNETETLPLYTNKDTIHGEVCAVYSVA